jgi:hypothetical protein
MCFRTGPAAHGSAGFQFDLSVSWLCAVLQLISYIPEKEKEIFFRRWIKDNFKPNYPFLDNM